MNASWIKIMIAAFFEVIWVVGLKHADSSLDWALTGFAILVSFYGMISAGKTLPAGTVYAVFTGLGTAGTVTSDIIFFHEPFHLSKVLLILLLLAGIIGLKTVTAEKIEERRKN
ncbi:DMT family transporter [Actinomycetes bacterium NPDC127524]